MKKSHNVIMEVNDDFIKFFDAQLWFFGWDIKNIYNDFINFNFVRVPKKTIGSSRYIYIHNNIRYDLWGWGVCIMDYNSSESYFYKRFKEPKKIIDLSIFTRYIQQPEEIQTTSIEDINNFLISDFFLKYETYISQIHGDDFRKIISTKEKMHLDNNNLVDYWEKNYEK
jgi:hypothetical protein